MSVEVYTGRLVELQAVLRDAEAEVVRSRRARDAEVQGAIASGVSAYRVAQVLGISQQAVAKIRDAVL